MSLFALVVSFGGGIIRVYMGALPASILTGAVAIAGSVATIAGGTGMTAGFIAFDSYLGPRIASAGGVTASTYAGRTKKLDGGADILSCLNGLADPATLLVGGVFGVIDFPVHYLIGMVLHLNTDLPGFTVILSVVITRLVFDSSGLIGKAALGEFREYFTSGRGMLYNAILGLELGTTTGFVYQALLDGGTSATVIGSYPVLCFRITAASLIFAQAGSAISATHHIALISALATVSSQNPVMSIVLGILTALFGDFMGKTFNDCCDTRIGPPAFTIFVFTFIVNIMFRSGFFSV